MKRLSPSSVTLHPSLSLSLSSLHFSQSSVFHNNNVTHSSLSGCVLLFVILVFLCFFHVQLFSFTLFFRASFQPLYNPQSFTRSSFIHPFLPLSLHPDPPLSPLPLSLSPVLYSLTFHSVSRARIPTAHTYHTYQILYL